MVKMSPKNNFLWIATESEEEEFAIMKKVERWSGNDDLKFNKWQSALIEC